MNKCDFLHEHECSISIWTICCSGSQPCRVTKYVVCIKQQAKNKHRQEVEYAEEITEKMEFSKKKTDYMQQK